jgi:parallel beta-helix repeat protein
LNIIGFSQGIYNFNLDTDKLGNIGVGLSNNTIIGNTITGPSDQSFQVGIWIQGSLGDKIIDNKVTGNNEFGILLYIANNSYISGNVVTGNKVGFSLGYSTDNIFRNNQIYENEENFRFAFRHPTEFIHDIDSSNMVNGKPIYYWINQHNKSIPSQAGFVALANCSEIIVQNLEILNNGNGILLYSTTNSVIKNNNLENNGNAIEIRSSHNITVSGNKVKGSLFSGVKLALSSNIRIVENDIVNNQFGITLSGYDRQHSGYGGSNNVSILSNKFTVIIRV